eukprot:m.124294 g.124294  ORF g.124294 m.124294 type:complete len:50 (+) comp15702_c0_seq1:2542-2691(+)
MRSTTGTSMATMVVKGRAIERGARANAIGSVLPAKATQIYSLFEMFNSG